MRVWVYKMGVNPIVDPPLYRLNVKYAMKLVLDGKAIALDSGAVQLLVPGQRRWKPKLKSNQAKVYEAIGIEKYPQILHGGLTRTETKPAFIPKFKAARVAH